MIKPFTKQALRQILPPVVWNSLQSVRNRAKSLRRFDELRRGLRPDRRIRSVQQFAGHLRERSEPVFFFPASREALQEAWQAVSADQGQALLREASRTAARQFDLLGSGPVEFERQIDWHADFKTGARWLPAPIEQLPIVMGIRGSDVKVPWELSRFYHAPLLAVAYGLSNNEAYPAALAEQMADWIWENPVGASVNWMCAMEVAIRAANWLAALPYCLSNPAFSDDFLALLGGSLLQHGRFIRSHLEGTPQLRSNHYLADVTGLLYLGILLPEFTEAQEWCAFAVAELQTEMERQVYPDGTDFEASTAYHRLCLELFLGPALLCRANGVSLTDAFWARLHRMFLAIRAVMNGAGRVPLIGDNDSGRLHRLLARDDHDLRYLLPIGAVLFDDRRLCLPDVPFSEEALLYLGPAGLEAYRRMAPGEAEQCSSALADSGWYTLRRDQECLTVVCGPNGQKYTDPAPGQPQYNGGHAHNDKLSVTYSVGPWEVLVDPGQLCYTSDAGLRNQCRSTAAHNVVQVTGLEQQALRSDYLFNIHDEHAKPTVTRWEPEGEPAFWFIGEHQGYYPGAGLIHERSIGPRPGAGFRVVDRFTSDRATELLQLTWHFHLAAGLAVRQVGCNHWQLGSAAELRFDEASVVEASVDADFVSPAYGVRQAATVLRVRTMARAPVTLTWEIFPTAAGLPRSAGGVAALARSTPQPAVNGAGEFAGNLHAQAEEVLQQVDADLKQLHTHRAQRSTRTVCYVRLDYWNAGYAAGGSVGHTAHVIRALAQLGADVHVAAGSYLPMVDPAQYPTLLLEAPDPKWHRLHPEFHHLTVNATMAGPFRQYIERLRPAFIYERPVLGNYVAAQTARGFGIPYVVEYNGSEIWVRRHWDHAPFHYEEHFLKIEDAVLQAADLIVAVSEPLRDELRQRGIQEGRILVNPNAVDPAMFDCERLATQARALRQELGFQPQHIVVGFIGTFGQWHGIPTLMAALPGLVALDPRIRLLLIGDGPLRPLLNQTVDQLELAGRVVLPGVIPQQQAPLYLAACDLFLSPHQTPPGDTRPFFGSPTKLFEYMAMSRPTVASRLGQIEAILKPALTVAEVLCGDLDRTPAVGLVVTPGDAAELVQAVRLLLDRPELGDRLAANARRRVLERHTWNHHVQCILQRLEEGTHRPIRAWLQRTDCGDDA